MKTLNQHDCAVLRKSSIAYPPNVSAYYVAVDSGYIDPNVDLDAFQETAAIFCAYVAANQDGVANPENSITFEHAIVHCSSPHAQRSVHLAIDQYTPFFVIALDKAYRSMRNVRPRSKINVDQLHYDLMHWTDDSVRRKWASALVDMLNEK